MDKMDELRAIEFIINQAKISNNNYFNSFKGMYTDEASNANLTINNPSAIKNLQDHLSWMYKISQEMAVINGIEAQIQSIHRTISLGSTMGPGVLNRDVKLQEIDKNWKAQLFGLKTQNQDFRTLMIEAGNKQANELSEKLGVSLSLDREKNTQQLEQLLQTGRITTQDYAVFSLGTDYLLIDPDFIASHSKNTL